jgi:hypothetical protein
MTQQEMIAALLRRGYSIDGMKLPAAPQPQRQTQAISESYNYQDDRERPNSWLPQSLQGRDTRAWRAAADRKVPFDRVFTHGETPDEVWQKLSSGLVYSMLTPNDIRRMNPDTEI